MEQPIITVSQFVWIILGMSSAVVSMAIYIRSLHKHHSTKITDALIETAKANQHLASSIDNLPENITNKILLGLPNQKKKGA